jgi:hypothetical protein
MFSLDVAGSCISLVSVYKHGDKEKAWRNFFGSTGIKNFTYICIEETICHVIIYT